MEVHRGGEGEPREGAGDRSVTIALPAAAFVLPLDGIDPVTVAAAMDAGIGLHEDSGAVWSAQGLAALMALRAYGEVIITDAPADLIDTLLDWRVGVTDWPLHTMSDTAVTIDCPPLRLTDAIADGALERDE